ncbi:hypothetical protein F7725_009616 [Dissostichus mawsoni]|uniref:Uncharacterized protein n=1 Tax=Dissostichus mawsoni TaxID=36200 RepID=A0A7J5XP50_DISMA|nr:hypothetical protein F7725_009616 [Dissostichus mawsoni]
MLKDSTGVEVDSDIFDELLNSSRVSFKAFTEECNVWDCEVAAILLLLHLLPPTSKGKKSRVKISAKDAAGRLVKFLRVCTQEGLCVCTVESLDVHLCFAHTLVTSGTYLEHMNTVLIQMSPAMLSLNLELLLELLFHSQLMWILL